MRDGLSLLDQALAMGAGNVASARVRDMLGLADRGRIFDLLEKLLGGATGEASGTLAALHRDGAEPGQILADLAEAVHTTTRAKTLGATAAGEGLSGEERRRASALGGAAVGGDPRARLANAAQGPGGGGRGAQPGGRGGNGADPPGLHGRPAGARTHHQRARGRTLRAGAGRDARRPRPCGSRPWRCARCRRADEAEDERGRERSSEPAATAARLPMLRTFADVVRLAGERREAKLKVHLEEHVSLVRFDPAGSIELHLLPGAPKELAQRAAREAQPGHRAAGWWP